MSDIDTRLARIEALLLDISNRLPRRKPQTDEAWIASFYMDPAYKGIDLDHEFREMHKWLDNHPGRKMTPVFVENWLRKAPRTVTVKVQPAKMPKFMQKHHSLPEGEPPPTDVIEKLGLTNWGRM